MKFTLHTLWIYLSIACFAVLAFGLSIDVMDVDASQYASISKEMVETGNYLQILHRAQDYLDKPPLLFWTSALSFQLFGYANWSYKIFSFLAILLGFISIYRFVLLFYSHRAAKITSLIYISNVAILLISNDIRTDTLLLGLCTFAVWQAAAYIQSEKMVYLIGLGIGAGMAMLAKGPIGLMLPISALGFHFVFHGEIKKIFKPGWLIPIIIIGIILFPMCWGLYQQFDVHPEKVVHGRTGVSGLYFYFWEQSFGRLTGQSDWKDDSSYFFFAHTFLWAFFPWILVFLLAIWDRLKTLFSKIHDNSFLKEGFIPGAILIPFIALSFSHYKLPHYIYITIPFASALAGVYLDWLATHQKDVKLKWVYFSHNLFLGLCVLFALSISVMAFQGNSTLFFILLIAIIGIFIWMVLQLKDRLLKIIASSIVSFILIGSTMNLVFYPNLLTYQSSSQVGKWIAQNNLPTEHVYAYKTHPHAIDFYSGGILNEFNSIDDVNLSAKTLKTPMYIYTNEEGLEDLSASQLPFEILLEQPHFKVTKLSLKFLNPVKRPQTLSRTYVLRVPTK